MSDDELRKRLDHIDEMLHDITRFIDDHRPALARGLSLMDPGARLRGLIPGRKHAVPQDGQG